MPYKAILEIGVSTATFFTKLLTEDSFSVIKRSGADLCEVFLTTFYEYEPSFGELLKERLQAAGLRAYSIHALNTAFEPQLFNVAPRTRNDAEKIYERVLLVGETIGAEYYTFHGVTRVKRNAYFDPAVIGKRMFELGKTSKDHGIELCFENVHWAAFNSPEFFIEAKEYAPNIGAVLDIKQARQSGRSWRKYLDAIGDRLRNVHLSDVKDGKIAMVGQGEFPFAELIERLKKENYDGALTIEQYAKDYEDFGEVAESVQYIKTLVGGAYANQI